MAKEIEPDCDYYIGVEGGIEAEKDGKLVCFAWVIVFDKVGTSIFALKCIKFLGYACSEFRRICSMHLGFRKSGYGKERNLSATRGGLHIHAFAPFFHKNSYPLESGICTGVQAGAKRHRTWRCG